SSRSVKWLPMNPAPPAIKKRLPVIVQFSSDRLPFRCNALQERMAYQQVPKDSTKAFGVRRDTIGRQRRNHDALLCGLAREAAVTPHNPEDMCARFRRRFESAHDIHRHVLLAASTAHRKDQHA